MEKVGTQRECSKGGGQDGFFLQEAPTLEGSNAYGEDPILSPFLKRHLSKCDLARVQPDLLRFGGRVRSDVARLSAIASRSYNKPRLVQHNGWGHRVDEIVVSPEWEKLHDVAAEEGVVSIGYDPTLGEHARLVQFVKLFMFVPVSSLVSCPLAMTDGAAKLIQDLDTRDPELRDVFDTLTSRDPKAFFTSGQWMTERTGGSDLHRTETRAEKDPDAPASSGLYRLFGYKFFTSATTSPVAFALARTGEGPGTRGLSLFFVRTRLPSGELNHLVVHRLKDKLGTDEVPTAELELRGTRARLVGEPGRGIPTIAALFNVTRIHTGLAGVSSMRYITALAKDYAHRREVAGRPLAESILHQRTLAEMEQVTQVHTLFVLDVCRRFGRSERARDPTARADAGDLLRLLTPLLKLYSSKVGLRVVAEGLECFGGAGYMEDTGIPRALRDQVVNCIWEGCTNVLALDVLRCVARSPQSVVLYANVVNSNIGPSISDPRLSSAARAVRARVNAALHFLASSSPKSPALHASARALAYSLAHGYLGALAIEHAAYTNCPTNIYMAHEFVVNQAPTDQLLPDADGIPHIIKFASRL
mmetsp:Transcript_21116/g.59412  ORF Transcript_21116/g.59412 Transcript_21116/m.59412 type:complete len:588 (+) Transcript_21116:119-1882(+)